MAFIKKTVSVNKAEKLPVGTLTTPSEVLELARQKGIEVEPLDIARLASALGIKTRYEPMKNDDSGSLKKEKETGQWVMTVNSLHHPHRQRFTIAHEIGHKIKHSALHDTFEDKIFFRNSESNTMEVEANRFAAELLMPKDAFTNFIKNNSTKVEDIASHFQVSSMAIRVRAKQLGYAGHNL